MSNFLPGNLSIEHLLAPAADAAGRTGTVYADLGNCQKAWLVFYVDQGNAATIAVSPVQATTAAGAGSKVLTNNVPIATILDMAAGVAWTRQTAAKNYTTDAGVKVKAIVFEITPEIALDVAGGFRYINVTTGASNAANITSAILIKQLRLGKG
jgi:hypothetical protein